MTALNAADSIRRLAEQYKGMVEAADILESIGSLEQAKQEAMDAAAKAGAQRDEIIAAQAKAQDELDATRAQIKADTDAAVRKIDAMVAEANAEAGSILSASDAEATRIIEAAKATAAKLVGEVSEQVAALTQSKADIEEQIKEAHDRLSSANAMAVDAEQRLADIKSAIAKLASA